MSEPHMRIIRHDRGAFIVVACSCGWETTPVMCRECAKDRHDAHLATLAGSVNETGETR